jgi:hypothetical protein
VKNQNEVVEVIEKVEEVKDLEKTEVGKKAEEKGQKKAVIIGTKDVKQLDLLMKNQGEFLLQKRDHNKKMKGNNMKSKEVTKSHSFRKPTINKSWENFNLSLFQWSQSQNQKSHKISQIQFKQVNIYNGKPSSMQREAHKIDLNLHNLPRQ